MKKYAGLLGLMIIGSVFFGCGQQCYVVKHKMQDILVVDFEKNQLESWNKRFLIEVKNPNNYNLYNTPVVIDLKKLDIVRDKKLAPGSFFITDIKSKKVALSQIDDMDGDKLLDEIVFVADVPAQSNVNFYLYYSEGGRIWQFPKRYTDASALPGWESEVFGYRSYFSFILDTFAKPKNNPNLLLRQLYDEQFRQLYNHHTKSDIGMDTLNVGNTSGLGGVLCIVNGKKIKPKEGPIKSEVIVSGPVRSIVKMTKDPWVTEAGTFTINRTATIYAHHFETQISDAVAVRNGNGTAQYGIGLRKEKISKYEALKDEGLFIQWHNQHKSIGEHGIGIYIDPSKIALDGEEVDDHYVLVKDSVDGNTAFKVDFVAFGAWKEGGYIKTAEGFKEFAKYIKQQQSTVDINIKPAEIYKK